MILVFCETSDLPALWVAGRLRARGLAVDIVTAEVLDCALKWRHAITANGVADVAIELADGRRISSAEPAGVLNRLNYAPRGRIERVGGADADYAAQEMNAFFLSWLETLPGPVLNRPTPQGLGGRWRHPSAWMLAAGQAGLTAAPYRQSETTDPDSLWMPAPRRGTVTAFSVAGVAVGPPMLGQAVLDGCVRLAQAADEGLIGVDFVPGPRGWEVVRVTPSPDLTAGGEPLVEALAAALAPAHEERAAS